MTNYEYREFEVRRVNTEARTVTGLAVPYGTTVQVGGYSESIERGAFGTPDNVALFYGHNHRTGGLPIGKVTAFRDTDEGLEIDAVISQTRDGEEVYTLLKDGVLNRFSVGFEPVEDRWDGETVIRTKALLKEVSIVPMPAYEQAKVAQVRDTSNEEDINMSKENEVTSEDVTELRETVTELKREIAVIREGASEKSEKTAMQFRSGGELLKALAAGDNSARMELRAFTGANTGDSVVNAAWINRGLKLVEVNRKAYNLFNHKALPGEGMTISYPKVSSVSGSVAEQAAQGDDLTYNEVILTTATADVKTYGGYGSISRQAIERSSVSYLETALDHLARNYGRATNSAVAAAVIGASGVNTGTGLTLSTSTADKWLNFVLEGSAAIEDNGLGARAEFMYVSRDVFNKIATFVDTAGRPMFTINADGVNTVGDANLVTASGSIAGLPLVVDQGLAAKTAFIGAAEAIEIYESAGAPYQLADENIINLTKDFSLYGYMAITVPNPKALFKVAVA